MGAMPYPVSVTVEPLFAPRNRMTTAFRLILAIPHLFLVGGIGFSMVFRTGRDDLISLGPETGLLGFVAGILAIVSWFTILSAASTSRASASTRISTCAGVSAPFRI